MKVEKIVSIIALSSLSIFANAAPNVMQKALKCKGQSCPYSYDFIIQPKVKKTIISSFNRSGFRTPSWLFSANSVTVPIERIVQNGYHYIKIDTCKPHFCNSDRLDGYYNVELNDFSGIYSEDGNEVRIE
jgi:hypothetical protein